MSDIEKSEIVMDKIHIADEVIAAIAALAVGRQPSIVPSSTGVGEGLAGFLGMKTPGKGVKVDNFDTGVSIDIFITMEYGARINIIARQLQSSVREDIEKMTGLKVLHVNVHVQGLSFKEQQKEMKALKDAKENKDYKNAKDILDVKEKEIQEVLEDMNETEAKEADE